MRRIVLKFGGSSVRDAEHLRNAATIIGDTYREGNQVVVVLSAQGDTTDELIAKAKEINLTPSKREMDMLLSAGEQVSVALCAMALETIHLPAVSLTAWQVGIHTTNLHGDARISEIDLDRLQQELDKNKIVLVAGFQGIDCCGDVTTLGRGGSDTSAVALAAVLNADLCRIYTDVEGVYTADPRLIPKAIKLSEVAYDEMLELSNQGAQVLHNRSVALAKKHHVDLEVLSSLQKKPGTKVRETAKQAKNSIIGVAQDTGIARIAVLDLEHRPGAAFHLFSKLSKEGINIDMILQSAGRSGFENVSFTISRADTEKCIALLEEQKGELGFEHIAAEEHIAKVSIVGSCIRSTPGIAATMFEAIYDAGINIQMISANEIRISVLIDEDDADNAVKAIHRAFFENGKNL